MCCTGTGNKGVEIEEGKGLSGLDRQEAGKRTLDSKLTAYTRSRRSSTLYSAAKS